MLTIPLPVAYADASSTSVSMEGNGLSGEYVSVDLYVKVGSEYLPASSNSFSAGTLGYTKTTSGGSTTYTFPASVITLSCTDLYVIVNSSYADRVYVLDYEVAESGTFNVTGSTYSMTSGNQSLRGLEAVPGTAYPITLSMTLQAYSKVNQGPELPQISVTVMVTDAVTSTVLDSTNTISAEVIAHYQNTEEAAEGVNEVNGNNEDHSFEGNDGSTYYITEGTHTGSTNSVYISDEQGGTSLSHPTSRGERDTFDLDVTIPAGQSFVVAVTISASLLAYASVEVTLTVGGSSPISTDIGSEATTYCYSDGNTLRTSTNINNVIWMQYPGNVSITISGFSQNIIWGQASVSVQLVFQS